MALDCCPMACWTAAIVMSASFSKHSIASLLYVKFRNCACDKLATSAIIVDLFDVAKSVLNLAAIKLVNALVVTADQHLLQLGDLFINLFSE